MDVRLRGGRCTAWGRLSRLPGKAGGCLDLGEVGQERELSLMHAVLNQSPQLEQAGHRFSQVALAQTLQKRDRIAMQYRVQRELHAHWQPLFCRIGHVVTS